MTTSLLLAAAASLLLPSATYAASNSSFEDMIMKTLEWNSNFSWTTCSETHYPNLDTAMSYTCANFTIPLDWADESAGQGSLALIRIAAVDQENKKGSIFINPGGPGESGIELVASPYYGPIFFNTSGGAYDIIGWDPRGVGDQTFPGTLSCFATEADYLEYFNMTLQGLSGTSFDYSGNFSDPTDIENYYSHADSTEAAYEGLKELCDATPSGPYFQYVGTVATARDIVAMTEFFEGKGADFNYWGFSYGTILGQTLVNMFPDRIGRVIIDGFADAELYWNRSYLQWRDMIVDTDEVFEAFGDACIAAGPERCGVADENLLGGMDVVSWTKNLTDWAHEEGNIGWSIRIAVGAILYSPSVWGRFSFTTLPYYYNIASNGTLADLAQQADAKGTTVSALLANLSAPHSDSSMAIEAGDAHDPFDDVTTLDLLEERVATSADVSGYFGLSSLHPRHISQLWPYRAVERFEGPFNSTLKNRILLATNTWDPVTPKSIAKKVATLFGDNAEYVEQHGYGHSTLAERSECMTKVYAAYWNDGTTPSGGNTLCEVDDVDTRFPVVSSTGIGE